MPEIGKKSNIYIYDFPKERARTRVPVQGDLRKFFMPSIHLTPTAVVYTPQGVCRLPVPSLQIVREDANWGKRRKNEAGEGGREGLGFPPPSELLEQATMQINTFLESFARQARSN